MWLVLLGALLVCGGAEARRLVVDLVIERPAMFGANNITINVYVPPTVRDLRLTSGCEAHLVWGVCGQHVLGISVSGACTWPVQVAAIFGDDDRETPDDEPPKIYRIVADVVNANLDSAHGATCALTVGTGFSDAVDGILPPRAASAEPASLIHCARQCRLSDSTLYVWQVFMAPTNRGRVLFSHDSAGDALHQLAPGHRIQLLSGPSLSLSAVTHPRQTVLKQVATHDSATDWCYCGYNVACRADVSVGARATAADVALHEPISEHVINPIARATTNSFTTFDSTQALAVIGVLIVFSVLAVVACIGLIFTQRFVILRNTRESDELIARALEGTTV